MSETVLPPIGSLTCAEPSLWSRLIQRVREEVYSHKLAVLDWILRDLTRNSNLVDHAYRELRLAGYDDGDFGSMARQDALQLIRLFATQGHSGGSAPIIAHLFHHLAGYKVLSPLTGEPSEWNVVGGPDGETYWQNCRASHVFKNSNGEAYDIDGIVFEEENGCRYTSGESRVPVTFPYTPTQKIVKVDAEYNPKISDSDAGPKPGNGVSPSLECHL